MPQPSSVAPEAQSQVAGWPYRRLLDAQQAMATTLGQADQRENALQIQLALTRAATRTRETANRLDNGGLLSGVDAELDDLHQRADNLRDQLAAASAGVAETRQLARVIQTEITARDARLAGEVKQLCYRKWQAFGKADEKARLAFARAILAYCGKQTSGVEYVEPQLFLSTVLNHEGAFTRLLREVVAADHEEARAAAIQADEMLGVQ